MQCPKCQYQQADGLLSCNQCGVVFEKYYKYHPDARPKDCSQAEKLAGADDSPVEQKPVQSNTTAGRVRYHIDNGEFDQPGTGGRAKADHKWQAEDSLILSEPIADEKPSALSSEPIREARAEQAEQAEHSIKQ